MPAQSTTFVAPVRALQTFAADAVPAFRGHVHRGQGLDEIIRYAADGVVCVRQAVERKIQVNHQLGAAFQQVINRTDQLLGQ